MKTTSSLTKRGFGRQLMQIGSRVLGISFIAMALLASAWSVAQTATQTIVVSEDAEFSLEEVLRSGVAEANQIPGLTRIEFAPEILEIELTLGQIEITEPLIISGASDQPVRIYRDGLESESRIFAVRDFRISESPTLRLEYLILEGGSAIGMADASDCSTAFFEDDSVGFDEDTGYGGAICSEASVELFETIIRDNQARFGGGGIWAAGDVSLESSEVTGNTLLEIGGGGGIATSLLSDISCLNSLIEGNSIENEEQLAGDGGGFYTRQLVAESCRINGNSAGRGGGIFATDSVDLTATTVRGNKAESAGGGVWAEQRVWLESSEIVDNEVIRFTSGQISGGGIATGSAGDNGVDGVVECLDSLVTGNRLLAGDSVSDGGDGIEQISWGGGIAARRVEAVNCVISGNSAGDGGGIDARSIDLEDSIVSGNRALFRGGGLWGEGGSETDGVFCTNSHIRDNVSSGPEPNNSLGGGAWASRFEADHCVVSGNAAVLGGGVSADFVQIVDSTISSNTAVRSGGGIHGNLQSGTVECSNSRIVDNLVSGDAGEARSGGGTYGLRFSSDNCIVSGNEAVFGGGVFASRINILNSTISANIANDDSPDRVRGDGGGIYAEQISESGGLRVVNSTISGNQSGNRGGGIFWKAPATTVDVKGDEIPDALIANSTVTDNSAVEEGGGVAILDQVSISVLTGLPRSQHISGGSAPLAMSSQGSLMADAEFDADFSPEIISTILSGNRTGDAEDEDPDLAIISTGDRSIILDDSASFIGFGDFLEIEFLRDNGCFEEAGADADPDRGCVLTHRPLNLVSNSLIDEGSDFLELQFDQRGSGFLRRIGAEVDIGSFETEPFAIEAFGLEVPSPLFQGEDIQIFWFAVPTVPAVECSGDGLPGTSWVGSGKGAEGFEIVDSTPLSPGDYDVLLQCVLDGQELNDSVPLEILPVIEVSLTLEPPEVSLGETATLSWRADPDDSETSCIASNTAEVAAWSGSVDNVGGFDELDGVVIDTRALELARGTYTFTLRCDRDDFFAQESVDLVVTDEDLVLTLEVNPASVTIGDSFDIEWSAFPDDGLTECTASGLADTDWDGALDLADSESPVIINSADLDVGTYELGLECSRPGQTQSVTADLEVTALELSLSATPSSLIRGDELTIEWTGTEGLVCSGSGLDGTDWPGAGKGASGTETISTAPLAAGDYTVNLSCAREGLTAEAQATITVTDLDLSLSATPSSLIRGDELTIEWTGTEGLVCSGSGLDGTSWPGQDKAASGTETIDTAPLERGEYIVGMICLRQGVEIQATEPLTVLAEQAELNLSAASISLGIEDSEFVEFTVSNASPNAAFELELDLENPPGYVVIAIFRRASSCSVESGTSNEVQCDSTSIPEWVCDVSDAGNICRLENLPAGGIAGVLVQYQGAGRSLATGRVAAENADQRSADQSIGN